MIFKVQKEKPPESQRGPSREERQVILNKVMTELEMQRKALVGLKQQRDVDRKRRLQFIIRIKKQLDAQSKLNFYLKLAVGASLCLSILSLISNL